MLGETTRYCVASGKSLKPLFSSVYLPAKWADAITPTLERWVRAKRDKPYTVLKNNTQHAVRCYHIVTAMPWQLISPVRNRNHHRFAWGSLEL